jgi:serine/threonine protein phosphatase PrpC
VASQKPLKWVLGARSETGYVRTANEDRMGWTRTPYGDVYVVSDGMGGYRGGALAADLTVRTLRDHLATLSANDASFDDKVRQAFVAANQAVQRERRPDDPETRDMGATAVALITEGARILVGHVGDSRAYLWRKRGGLRQLTRDHTRVQKMLDAGLITPAQAAAHPDASVLDRAIGHLPTVEADLSAWMPLKPGDMVLLCSDGLCGYVDDGEINSILRTRGDPQVLADRLVDCALLKGGEDNVTVQLVLFSGPASSAIAKLLGEPIALLPLGAILSAAVAWVVATEVVAPIGERVDALQAKLDGWGRSQAPVAAPAPPPPAASQVEAAPASAPALPAAPVAAPAPAPVPAPAASQAERPRPNGGTTAQPQQKKATGKKSQRPATPAANKPSAAGSSPASVTPAPESGAASAADAGVSPNASATPPVGATVEAARP